MGMTGEKIKFFPSWGSLLFSFAMGRRKTMTDHTFSVTVIRERVKTQKGNAQLQEEGRQRLREFCCVAK